MPRYFAALTIVLMLGIVLTRVFMLRRKGVEAMNFGKIDKTDFFIPPLALFYFYLVFAAAIGPPQARKNSSTLKRSPGSAWGRALRGYCCYCGVLFPLGRVFALASTPNIPTNS